MRRAVSRAVVSTSVVAVAMMVPAQAMAIDLDTDSVPARTQISVQYGDGRHIGTANEHESRPALSLSKLYLGYGVLRDGAQADKNRVENMIRYSEDAIATDLDRKYPNAISQIINDYGLADSHYNGFWGHTTTSTADVTSFLEAIRYDPIAAPIMSGMATAAPVAADGYRQDYGTATLPGMLGTKFGWSDDGTINASASVGPGFSIAASTYGPPSQLTEDVQNAVRPGAAAPSGNEPQYIDFGSGSIPVYTGAQVRDRLACSDPVGALQYIGDDWLIPAYVVDAVSAMPTCSDVTPVPSVPSAQQLVPELPTLPESPSLENLGS